MERPDPKVLGLTGQTQAPPGGGAAIGLDPEQVERLFPFHIALDRTLRIEKTGASLRRICPGVVTGALFSDWFEITRPTGVATFDDAVRNSNALFLIRCKEPSCLLRGELVATADRLLFLGSPWLTQPGDLTRFELSLEDFAIHDATCDLLQVVQAQDVALRDARELAGRLTKQRAALRTANEQLLHQNAVLVETESRLRQQEAESRKLAMIASYTDTAVILTDHKGYIEWVNEGFVKLTGYTLEEAAGKKPGTLLQGPSTDRSTVSWIREQLRKGEPFNVEIINYSRNGREYWTSIHGQPIHDEEGNISHFMALQRDISERRQVAEELRRARDEAEQANRAKSDFLAMMSHEIRTPMNGVVGFTGVLLETPMDASQRDCVENIRSCADSLLAIINDILDFSKIESNHMEFSTEPVALRACVEDAMGVFGQAAGDKRLELAYTLAPDLPEAVLADPLRLRQILVNLIGNAVKFTHEGVVSVDLTAGETAGRPVVEFAVRDTGIGIPKDTLPRLFSPFTQADSTTTRRYGGSGLGLAICKRLVNLMGGDIAVDSVPGKGSVFRFQLPLTPAEPPVPFELPLGLKGKRALVVEGCETLLTSLGAMLRTAGMEADLTPSADEAKKLLASPTPYDVLVIEQRLAHEDGHALVREATALPGRNSLPAVMLGSPALVDTGGGVGAVVPKPVRLKSLLQGVLNATSARDSAKTGAGSPPAATSADGAGKPLAALLPLRILVAEDFPTNQKIIKLMLRGLGYSAEIAETGEAAVAAASTGNYDLVFMDMHMPEMDGLEATRAIRAAEARKDAKPVWIVALTANAMVGDREKCLQAGMNDYLSKPVTRNALEAAIRHTRSPVPSARH